MSARGLWRTVSWGVAAVVLFQQGAAAAERTDFATLMSVFDQMVLRDQGRVSKWPNANPVTVKSTANFAERENAILNDALAIFAKNSGLTITRDDTLETPKIVLETAKTLPDHPSVGFVNIGITNSVWGRLASEMRRATIKIIEDWYRRNQYSIYRTIPHELMHALGFHGHPLHFDSVLSLQYTRNSLSEWDLFFVRVLYDPELPVGTPRVFALPIVCRIMHQRLVTEKNPYVTDLNSEGTHPYCAQFENQQIAAKTSLDELRFGWAYLSGVGVKSDLVQAEHWTRKALDNQDKDAPALMKLVESAKAARTKVAAGAQPQKPAKAAEAVRFKPAAEGTVFQFADNRGSLTIHRIDDTTVHTINSSNGHYRWAGLFFGRGSSIGVSEAETIAARIWPLEIGKSIRFEHKGRDTDGKPATWSNEIKVIRRENLRIDGRAVATYVVERHVTRQDAAPSGEGYEARYTFWYAPDFGFHAKYQSRFAGRTNEKPVSWAVASVRPPEVPTAAR